MSSFTQTLKEFLYLSNKAGYAGGDAKKWIAESDGSTTIPFAYKQWKSHDNFFGGEPYGGRVVVFYDNKPVWIMVYYGWVKEGTDPDMVYEILREALMHMPNEYPYRGPEKYTKNTFTYHNTWHGAVDRFSGEEIIQKEKELLYKANYLGGFVDQRKGV